MENQDDPGRGTPGVRGAKYMTLGFEMAIPIVLLMYLGHKSDAWLGTEPWLFLVGALLGIAVGLYSMFKRVGLIGRRDADR